MNRNFLKFSILAIFSSVAFLAGCGPEGMSDADFQNDVNAAENAPMPPSNPGNMNAPNAPMANAQAPADKPEGCPVGKNCPSGNCEIPADESTYNRVQLPDQHKAEPVKVRQTEERQLATHVVDYHRTIHVAQPAMTEHTAFKHHERENILHTKVKYHPTHRRVNKIVRTHSVKNRVMPVIEEVEPLIDYGCAAPAPAPVPVVTPIVIRPVPVPVLRPYPFIY